MKKLVLILLLSIIINSCVGKNLANKNFTNQQIIYLVLQNTQEYAVHNMMGHDGNSVYIHPVMDYEVVKDKKGNILKNHFNAGSYNFYSPTQKPLQHYELDIEPWIKYGNYPKDPTTKEVRSNYYTIDLVDGIIKTLDQKINSQIKDVPNSFCCEKTLREFETYFGNTKPNSIFYYFHNNKKIDKKDLSLIIQSLQKSLRGKIDKESNPHRLQK